MKKHNPDSPERQNPEDVFSASEEKYKGLLQSIRDGKILYANKRFAKILNHSVGELTGCVKAKNISERLPIIPQTLSLLRIRMEK
ncbi:MAG: PAS domain-containing protein [Smithella sp.]